MLPTNPLLRHLKGENFLRAPSVVGPNVDNDAIRYWRFVKLLLILPQIAARQELL